MLPVGTKLRVKNLPNDPGLYYMFSMGEIFTITGHILSRPEMYRLTQEGISDRHRYWLASTLEKYFEVINSSEEMLKDLIDLL